MNIQRFVLPLLVFALLVGVLAAGLRQAPREIPSPLLGKPVPVFVLPTLHDPGQSVGAANLRGRVWILNVWASWCSACLQEHPVLLALARQGGVPMYGLNYKDQREAGVAWLAARGNPYAASLFDESGRVGIDLGVYGVPETFIIDSGGLVRYKHVGPLTPDVVNQDILPLLRQLHG